LLLILIGFRLCDATEITVIVVVAGSAQHRGTARAQPVQQCEEESTRAKYVKRPGLLQPVEKKGKCASSIAPIIWRPQKSVGPTWTIKMIENKMLARRFSIAPMMDWTGTSRKAKYNQR
jgi:hypothetical protein